MSSIPFFLIGAAFPWILMNLFSLPGPAFIIIMPIIWLVWFSIGSFLLFIEQQKSVKYSLALYVPALLLAFFCSCWAYSLGEADPYLELKDFWRSLIDAENIEYAMIYNPEWNNAYYSSQAVALSLYENDIPEIHYRLVYQDHYRFDGVYYLEKRENQFTTNRHTMNIKYESDGEVIFIDKNQENEFKFDNSYLNPSNDNYLENIQINKNLNVSIEKPTFELRTGLSKIAYQLSKTLHKK
jgi:hypothetical protein